MLIIKYRIKEGKINEILADSNITSFSFIKLINDKLGAKVTKCYFRGKILDNDDLIRNHITSPDYVLVLLTDSEDYQDIMDFDQGSSENKEKMEVKNSVTSSLIVRKTNDQRRQIFRYTFTIYTTATPESMLKGNQIDFPLTTPYYTIRDEVKKLILSFPQIRSKFDFDFYMFLPGGVPFKSGSLADYYENLNNISVDNIYVIVIKKPKNSYSIDDIINEPCSFSSPERKEILSPFCESSLSGLTQISTFLGYMFHGGLQSEQILIVLSKITRFAPLVVNLFRLIEKRSLNVLNILAITAPLFTLFRSMLPDDINNENIFEYTLNFLSIFDMTPVSEYLTIFEIDIKNDEEDEEMEGFVNYCKRTKQQQNVIVWTVDTINKDFSVMTMKPKFSLIENSFSVVKTFIPVAPLSLHYVFNPTFIIGKEDKSVMLFIKEVPDKENFVLIIDPIEGNPKEINIEELAHQLNCQKKNDVFNLIDPNKVDQVIFICFDESTSMKWKLEGKNPIHNEMTRANLASEFLKALVKQSYSLRVSSFYGLISFGSDVKIQQPLTALTSHFIKSLEQINPHGKTLLYDAINTAQHQIINLIKDKDGNNLYPNSRLRIIVITDGSDNKSKTLPEILINELIQNDIVVDTVLVSLTDQSKGCCAISKLTGGLCFRPKNLEEGIQIFEQEAFLNIKIRHMNPLPYDQITSEIFNSEIEKTNNQYVSYVPNQIIINANSKFNLATPKYMSYIKMKKKIKKYRIMCSFNELNYIDKNPNDSYVVYSLYSTPEEWRIFIKGPKNTPFFNKWLNLYMVIPSNYPNEPPQFRFLTIPFHPNISSEGKVIFSLNDKNYLSSLGIDSIITGIIKLLEKPEINYPINRQAMNLYLNNKEEFIQKQKEGEIGCNDYHQYLQDIKIYNEIPANIIIPSEDRGKSRVVSITAENLIQNNEKLREVKKEYLLDINDFEKKEQLGHGSYGVIYLVIRKSDHQDFAAKVLMDESKPFDYIKLVNIIGFFKHRAILKLIGYCLTDFKGHKNDVMIMENVPNGDLQKIIDEERNGEYRDGFNNTQKLIILYGIASGMTYSVYWGVTHCDLKPENILMTNELLPKICDFDCLRLKSDNNHQTCNTTGQNISTPLYMAPEVIVEAEGFEKYSEKSDVYAFSMIAYQLITSLIPYPTNIYKSTFKLLHDVVKGVRPLIPNSFPRPFRDLLTECWHQKPEKRPTFKEVAEKLKSNDFLNLESIDREKYQDYIDYIDENNDAFTKSQYIRPKRNSEKKIENPEDIDEILKHSKEINIINIKEYNKNNLLGKGQYNQVFKIIQNKTGLIFAARISIQPISSEISQSLLSEVMIMKSLYHPSILKFIGYSPIDFEDEHKPTIIIEYSSNGTLQDVIDNKSSFKLDDTKKLIIIYGIVAGMLYLHEKSFLHNDLKPSNILIDKDLHPKIADFGLAHKIENEDNKKNDVNNNRVIGTPNYIAPEVWNVQSYSKANDVYSFGILLYELVYMKKAFSGLNPAQIVFALSKKKRPPIPDNVSSIFEPLILRCWDNAPSERPSFKEILNELNSNKYTSKNVDTKEFKKYCKFIQSYK